MKNICKMDQVSDVVFSCRLAKHLLKKLLKHIAFIFCKLALRNIFGWILAVLLVHLLLRATVKRVIIFIGSQGLAHHYYIVFCSCQIWGNFHFCEKSWWLSVHKSFRTVLSIKSYLSTITGHKVFSHILKATMWLCFS